MKKLLSYLLLIVFFSFSFVGQSQDIDITYENPLGIEIFGNQEIFRVLIKNNTDNIIDANSVLQINLPVGISYVANSVCNNFTVVSEMDVYNPEFIVINTIATGETIILEFEAEAKCNSYQFIDDNLVSIKNRINYFYSISGVSQPEILLNETDSYNLSFSSVSLDLPLDVLGSANQTLVFNNVNELLTQKLNISIPGNSTDFSTLQINISPTDELEFMGISEITIGATNYNVSTATIIAPVAPSNTTKIVLIASDIDTSFSYFSANMLIEVKFDYMVTSCFNGGSNHVEYESVIGSIEAGNCVIAKSVGDFQFFPLAPSLSYSFDSDDGLNLCGETSSVEYTITNSMDASGAAYNIHLLLNTNYGCEISNIRINNIPVDTSTYTFGNDSRVHLFGDEISGLIDLTDEDNDGEIDDLAPGASISIKCDVSLIPLPEYFSSNNCDNGFHGTYFQSEFYSLSSECETIYSTDNLGSKFQLIEESNSNNLLLDVDFDLGESNHVQFCFDRNGGGYENQIYDDVMLLEANIVLPCGTGLDLSFQPIFTTENGTELSVTPTTTVIDEKLVLNLKVTDPYVFSNLMTTYGGCFEFDLLLDSDNLFNCTDTERLLEATVYGTFSECFNQKINLGCDEKELYLHYFPLLPSCPNEYPIVTSSFNAIRTSYGRYSDGTQITIEGVDNNEFQNLNTNGAYASDTIRTEIIGEAVCDVGSDEIFYGYIWYSHPENIPILTMTQAEYSVGSSDPIVTNDFIYREDLSTSIRVVYEIKISNQQVSKYDVVKISGFFSVNKMINNNEDFPNVYPVKEFRGGINVTPNLPESPYHYGTYFEIYGLDYFGGLGGAPVSCSSDGDFYISFHVQGGFQDDFPNEFRNVIQIIGPLEVIIPASVNDNIVLTSAEYVVTGIYDPPNLSINSVEGNPGVFRLYDSEYGELEEFRPFDKTSTTMYCSVHIRLKLNDCSLSEGQTIDVVGAHLEQGYAEEPLKEIVETNYPTRIVSDGSGFNPGDLRLDIVNPFFQTVGAITSYKIDIDNISSQQAIHPWIKFTYPGNLISITNSSIDGYDIVGAIYGTNTLLLKLEPINANNEMEGHIDVALNNCNFYEQNIDIEIETGVSCGPISDDILNNDGIICPLDTNKKIELEIIKSNLRMDVMPLFDSNALLQYCDSFQYVVQIFNNEKANITSPNFKIDVPNGFEMSVQYRYPVSEAIDPTNPQCFDTEFSSPIDIVSGQLWDLEGTNGILPGYIANQSGYLNNYYQLLVTFKPTCDYDGVSSINFAASGITNCTETKEITFQSTPVFLELEQANNYSHQLSIDVQENVDFNNYLAIVHYQSDTDISELTGLITIRLPDGIYSADNLNFTLPLTGSTDFTFNFTTDIEYCGGANFFIDTIVEKDIACNTDISCVKSFDYQDSLIENICFQECDINAKFEVQKISDCTYQFINYSVVNNWDDVQYLWDFGDGNTSTEFEPTHTYIINGNNNVSLTVINTIEGSCKSNFGPIKIEANKCFEDGSCIDITNTTDLDLFPNPSNGIFTLSFNNCIKFCEIRVFDVLGKIIYQKIIANDNQASIDISNCSKGAYLVRVSNDTMSITKRIIIE